jgi:hypothetical protein
MICGCDFQRRAFWFGFSRWGVFSFWALLMADRVGILVKAFAEEKQGV